MKESAYTEMLEKMTKKELLEEYQKVFKEPCIDSNKKSKNFLFFYKNWY